MKLIPIQKSIFQEQCFKAEIPPDGSCFFHSIISCLLEDYHKLDYPSKYNMIMKFRHELSNYLEQDNIYSSLSRGSLFELSKQFNGLIPEQYKLSEYSLEFMLMELRDKGTVDEKYLELISNFMNIDIYIIDSKTDDIIVIDEDIYHKDRRSIVLYFDGSHYDHIVVKRYVNDDFFWFFNFDTNDIFIRNIKNRIKELTKIE